jgi:hypothetical protein
MSDPITDEIAAALLKSEGFTVTPPAAVPPSTPPPPAQVNSASLWKPRRQEFKEADFDSLATQLPNARLIKYALADQEQDGVAGHVLIATQEI